MPKKVTLDGCFAYEGSGKLGMTCNDCELKQQCLLPSCPKCGTALKYKDKNKSPIALSRSYWHCSKCGYMTYSKPKYISNPQ